MIFKNTSAKMKRCGQRGPIPCLQSQVVSACQSFRPVAPLFFSDKSTIFGFLLNTEMGVAI